MSGHRNNRRGNPSWGKYTLRNPPEKSKWELKLLELGITEQEVNAYLYNHRGGVFELWIKRHYTNIHIPEAILDCLGLEPSDGMSYMDYTRTSSSILNRNIVMQ